MGFQYEQSIQIFCDNKATCDIVHNHFQHDRTKNVKINELFIKEELDEKIVKLPQIHSEDQLANIMHKSSIKSSVLKVKLDIWDIYAPT